ncbi:MAG: DUF2797 domain-containing protein [Gammaproteobacteria bacterium]|jgi:hypothetical protein
MIKTLGMEKLFLHNPLVSGILHKMQVVLSTKNNLVEYYLVLDGKPQVALNAVLGRTISLEFSGLIKCIYCQQKTKNSYSQGYCYPCARKLARCDLCILHPKNCHYHLGTCKEPEWGKEHCFSNHIVYLANSSGIKVGITRASTLPVRWIDQGAIQALPIISTQSRYQSGLVEAILAKVIPEQTNWRKMLAFDILPIDLIGIRDRLLNQCKQELQSIEAENLNSNEIIEIKYPNSISTEYNINLNNLSNSVKKSGIISGKLLAIKGQYLVFPQGIINIRSLTGYEVCFKEL